MRFLAQTCLAGALAVAAAAVTKSDEQPSDVSPRSEAANAICQFYSQRDANVDSFFRNLAAAETDDVANSSSRESKSTNISLWFHVINSLPLNSTERDATDTQLHEQLRILNEEFKPANMSFSLINTTWTVEPEWASFTNYTTQDRMKKTLHQGGPETLNLYILEDSGGHSFCEALSVVFAEDHLPGRARPVPEKMKKLYTDLYGEQKAREMIDYLGKGELPPGITPETASRTQLDGCAIEASSLPGSFGDHVGRGEKTVHEVGHWLGLLHTFYGGCDLENDFIADTPAMLPPQGCGTDSHTLDSCPGLPGLDPVENFMSYSNEFVPLVWSARVVVARQLTSMTSSSVKSEFTPGQMKRMHTLWELYRSGESRAGF